jgi:hypothetical protein
MKTLMPSLLLAIYCSVWAMPCTGIDRHLPARQIAALAPIVSKQLHTESAKVVQSYRYRGWYMLYVATDVSDPPFLFYQGKPGPKNFRTMWSGAAAKNDGPEIVKWTRQNAKGIPAKLAECFAWQVTQGGDL